MVVKCVIAAVLVIIAMVNSEPQRFGPTSHVARNRRLSKRIEPAQSFCNNPLPDVPTSKLKPREVLNDKFTYEEKGVGLI